LGRRKETKKERTADDSATESARGAGWRKRWRDSSANGKKDLVKKRGKEKNLGVKKVGNGEMTNVSRYFGTAHTKTISKKGAAGARSSS